MKQYHELLDRILDRGIEKGDRTGTGTLSVFGHQMRFNLAEGFPLVTTKRIFWRGVVEELLWILRGETNVRSLQDKGVRIWDEWADENGELGPVYGKQWRSWPSFEIMRPMEGMPHGSVLTNLERIGTPVCALKPIDQISNVTGQIRNNPDSRRLIVSAWNPADIDSMALPPCHMMFQFYTRPMNLGQRMERYEASVEGFPSWDDVVPGLAQMSVPDRFDAINKACDERGIPTRFLDCQLYQRSADVFLGVPFNIASYALLTHMIAHVVGMEAGEFVWTGGDTHST